MSNDPNRAPGGPGGVDDLQFDRAEAPPPPAGVGEPAPVEYRGPVPPPGVTACAACGEPITDAYFEANGKVVCPRCRDAVLTADASGNPFARFVKATCLGILGGLVGAAIWWAVRYFLHLQAGLIAILVGLLVGGGVRMGSQNRGGAGYQVLAVLLTYLSIAANYLPDLLVMGFDRGDPTPVVIISAVINALAQPFLRGMTGIIGLLIIGFALYQAWVMNKPARLNFNGPYRLATATGGMPPPPLPRA